MSGITTLYQTPRAGEVFLSTAQQSLLRDIQKLDGRLFVRANAKTKKFEVWRLGEDGKEYIISSYEPRDFDSRVLVALQQNDMWGQDVLARVDKHNARVEKNQEDVRESARLDLQDRLDFIIRKYVR